MGAPESSRGGRIKGLFNVSCMSVSFEHDQSGRCGRCKARRMGERTLIVLLDVGS